jgi:hypothetical protein
MQKQAGKTDYLSLHGQDQQEKLTHYYGQWLKDLRAKGGGIVRRENHIPRFQIVCRLFS